jgi:hypothetical protein
MSTENVQTIIGRAIVETEYRSLLFSDPEKALEGYELTVDEAESLKSLDRERFDEVASQVEDRISKSGIFMGDFRVITDTQSTDAIGKFFIDLSTRMGGRKVQ